MILTEKTRGLLGKLHSDIFQPRKQFFFFLYACCVLKPYSKKVALSIGIPAFKAWGSHLIDINICVRRW